jgi:hypothetical protein
MTKDLSSPKQTSTTTTRSVDPDLVNDDEHSDELLGGILSYDVQTRRDRLVLSGTVTSDLQIVRLLD